MFIRFTIRVFRERLSVCVCASFPFGFEGGMWELIVLVPGHYFPFYFACCTSGKMSFAQSCRSLVRKYG